MLDFLLNHTPLFYLVQSFWRDEAFSVLISQRPLGALIGTLNFEPPLYYILLHVWIKLFGTSEIATRSLSFIGFALATVVVIFWAEKMFKKHWLYWITPILFFFNPMLLYYSFEVRAYGWYMFFATLSLYAYSTKKYKLLTIVNILGFYTHSYAVLIPFVQLFHYLIVEKKMKLFSVKKLIKDSLIRSIALWSLIISPWVYIIFQEAMKGRPTWYFPVDLQLVLSVLGNMFTSYDGTPGGLWTYTTLLSLLLLGIFIHGLKNKLYRTETSYYFLTIFLPLAIIIGISFLKPVFVNRYLIFVTISQVILIAYSIFQIPKKSIQIALVCLVFVLSSAFNIYLPSRKAKTDIRSTILEANLVRNNNDLLYVSSPLIFFEAVYYTPDKHNVYLYNPENNDFPWYVGESAFSASQMTNEYPEYPQRAVLVGEDKSITIVYNIIQSEKPYVNDLPLNK